MVSRELRPQLSTPKDTSIPSSSLIPSMLLQRREEEWLVLRDRDTRLP